jgi:subtilase family serine protease
LPAEVRVVVDPTSGAQPNGAERECREDNNTRSAAVDPGELRADLSVEILTVTPSCPSATVETRVRNLGSAPAKDVVVRYFAGDPAQGGTMLHEQVLAAAIGPGAETTFTVNPKSLPERGAITIFAVVDPDRAIDECDEANNRDEAETVLLCDIGPD